MKLWICGFICVVLCAGCNIIDTGPKLANVATEGTVALTKVLLTQYKPNEMTAGANADLKNPEYVVEFFVGTGVYTKMVVRLIGGEAEFSINSAGAGTDVPTELKVQVMEILGNEALSEQDRKDRLADVFMQWILSKNTAPAATDETPQ